MALEACGALQERELPSVGAERCLTGLHLGPLGAHPPVSRSNGGSRCGQDLPVRLSVLSALACLTVRMPSWSRAIGLAHG